MMRILIAGAKPSEQYTLNNLGKHAKHVMHFTDDQKTSLNYLTKEHVDLVILGSHFSFDEGKSIIDVAKKKSDPTIPIIAFVSTEVENKIVNYLEAGIHDFINDIHTDKMLEVKLANLEKMIHIRHQFEKEHSELEKHQQHIENDLQIAKVIFKKILQEGDLNSPIIKYALATNFSYKGELLIAQKKPNNDLCIMFGDFPGYGLQASIGAIPISEIFYKMVSSGYSINNIISEINKRLKSIFPAGVFCRACLVDIDFNSKKIKFWNAGMPEFTLWNKKRGIEMVNTNSQFPLGVVDESHFQTQTQEINFENGDKIYLFSDALLKMTDPHGKELQKSGLMALFQKYHKEKNIFEALQKELIEYSGNTEKANQFSLAEVTLIPFNEHNEKEKEFHDNHSPMQDWIISLELHPVSLREFDPLPLLLNIIMECPDLHEFRGQLYTILAELYSNALEHGVLKMDSDLKKQHNGLSRYYEERMKRLHALEEGYVRFTIRHTPEDKGTGILEVLIEDSGEGFDYTALNMLLQKSSSYSGRGIPLIKHLADEIQFEGNGNRVKVRFHFQKQK